MVRKRKFWFIVFALVIFFTGMIFTSCASTTRIGGGSTVTGTSYYHSAPVFHKPFRK